jgi:hypothetical protein
MTSLRLSVAVTGLLVLTLSACSSPTPAPTPSPAPGQPTVAPGDPSPGASPGPSQAPGVSGSPAADLLPPEPQPALPGIYLPAGFLARGTDHFAQIQAPTNCATLSAVLGAGQWAVTDEAHLTIPTPGPGETAAPMPDLTPPSWLLLHWGDQTAVARVGGDETGCLAQIWRLPKLDYEMHGAIESAGQAESLQVQCAVGLGMAELGFFYFGDDGTIYSMSTTVPLKVGSHAVPLETEIRAGDGLGIGVDDFFPLIYGGQPEPEDGPRAEQYGPADPEGGWQGTIDITSTEPLVGEIRLDDLRNAADERLSLTTGFRCDLRPGALARAAEEAANATPSPAPSPSPAPGHITVEIGSGPHAGTHEAESGDAMCSLNALGEGWLISYSAIEPVAGELQALNLTMPEAGGQANVTMYFGEDFERDWFLVDDADATVLDNDTNVEFSVTGRENGIDFTITFLCNNVARF